MVRILTFVTMMLAGAAACFGQAQAGEKAVLAVVQRFFDAMASHDAAAARAIILPEGRYFSVRDDGMAAGASLAEFADRLPSRKEQLTERMFQPEVRVRGPLATVWTAYDFHRDGKFSHCGVDAFTLVRTKEGWKISSLVYTVEPSGCPERPPLR